MTFFDKLLTSKNKLFKCDGNPSQAFTRSSDASFDSKLGKVRVVLFRECERRGRKLLFDSEAVEKVALGCSGRHVTHPDVVEITKTHAFKYKKPNKDVSSLGEMMFGSVALASKGGTTTKIHNIPSPSRLLFTTVLPTSVRCHPQKTWRGIASRSDTLNDGCASDPLINFQGSSGIHRSAACNSLISLNGCKTLSGCERRLALLSPDDCCESRLSGDTQSAPASRRSSNSTSQSFFSSFSSTCDSRSSSATCSGGSLNSLRKRWNQSLAVSLDLSSRDESDDTSFVRARTKLGLALVLNIAGPHETDLENFLLNNSLTLESILERLRRDIEAAYQRVDAFVQLTYGAYEKTASAVAEMIRSRQDMQPHWLRPIVSQNRCQRSTLTTKELFVSGFCSILRECDSKTTNFFMSTLLSAVLTHNLSWVSNVVAQTTDPNHRSETQSIKGYNPLWAQYSELFGAVSTPARAAKIVLADPENKSTLNDILHILLYFLRSSTVIEHHFEGNFSEIIKKNTADWESDSEKPWVVDDNFDSGIDCEMRDVVLASCSNEPKIERCQDILLKSSCTERKPTFVENLAAKKSDCCNSLESACNLGKSLYPDIGALARLENVRLEDLMSARDKTLFVDQVLEMVDLSLIKTQTLDEGYDAFNESNVRFVLGDCENFQTQKPTIVAKSSPITPEFEQKPTNIPIIEGLKILHDRSITMEQLDRFECELSVGDGQPVTSKAEENLSHLFREIPMPWCSRPLNSRVLPPCPVLGGVSQNLQPHHAIQAVIKRAEDLDNEVRADLTFMASGTGLSPVLAEAVYVVADLQKWTVLVHSSQRTTLGTPRAVRAAASQLVADMLESFNHLHQLNFPSIFCLDHLEKKLIEIYRKSEAVAELLMTTEFCTVDMLTSKLRISVNDVPLLLSVATTHTPEIGEKYGISFS